MSHTTPFPAMPQRPLDYWLNSDMARMAPETTTSALRDMAWTFGQWRGLAAAMTGLGIAVLGGGILAVATMPGVPGLWISLLVAGAAMLAAAVVIRSAKLPRIAHVSPPQASRAPGKTSSGVGLAALITLAVGGPMALALGGWLSQGPGPAMSFVLVALLFLVGTASVFVAPAYCMQHARRDFRAYIARTPAVHQDLEAMSLNWHDPTGTRNFGPL